MAWLTNAELVASVGNAGGLGVLGPNAGQYTPARHPGESAERMRREIKKIREISSCPFAINYLLPIPGIDATVRYMKPLLEVCLDEKIKILLTAGDLHSEAKKTIINLKNLGFFIIHRDYSPTVTSALMAQSLGVDIYIATGSEAGGLLPKHELSTLSILPQICRALKIPVISAGGIVDKASARAAFELGASGVYVGTRFIMAKENPAHINTKEFIKRGKPENLKRISSPLGEYRSLLAYHDDNKSDGDIINKTLGGFRTGMLEGKINEGVVSVSTAVGSINSIMPAKEIVCELASPFIRNPAEIVNHSAP
ncbi:MAG: nitronate monooxygenase [Alistipes senegalensis]|nr:nitronate monooxygenase [Oxalobacter formigenes]MCM1281514.1 nitronate monooxygenase [Alistipes senegalensis]